jgi:hypothetical protein
VRVCFAVVAAGACGAAPSKIRERRRDRARAATSRPGDGTAAPHLPHRRGGGLRAEQPSRCVCNPTPPLHRVAKRYLHFMHGPARVLVGK